MPARRCGRSCRSGPTGYGDSPYQPFSTFAGNPLLISPDALVADGLLEAGDLERLPPMPAGHVDYGAAIARKRDCSTAHRPPSPPAPHRRWPQPVRGVLRCAGSPWLDDFALFMALKESHGGRSWTEWPDELRRREPGGAGRRARATLARRIDAQRFRQFLFFRQWSALRARCREAAASRSSATSRSSWRIDSADVWANPELFQLDDARHPTVVAGVPPDYFSATGQLWGNPLYRWDAHVASGFALVDRPAARGLARHRPRAPRSLPRLRGLLGSPGRRAHRGARAAGLEGPGAALLRARSQRELGRLPIIAEDLGVITPAGRSAARPLRAARA